MTYILHMWKLRTSDIKWFNQCLPDSIWRSKHSKACLDPQCFLLCHTKNADQLPCTQILRLSSSGHVFRMSSHSCVLHVHVLGQGSADGRGACSLLCSLYKAALCCTGPFTHVHSGEVFWNRFLLKKE